MKKILLLIILSASLLTGCTIRRDTMENITIYTSAYPIEYITKSIYGTHSKIESIYPYGIDNSNYTLTEEHIKLYSSDASLFIFNGINKEKNYVSSMISYNKNLKIIDATKSIDYEYGEEELWLNPSNVLMMAKNIKEGFDEYISNQYLKNDIKAKYEELKLTISKLEAKIYFMVETADNNSIIVTDDTLKFLEKYGFKIYSLDEDSVNDKVLESAKSAISKNSINYIFTLNEDVSDVTKEFIDKYKLEKVIINDLSNLSDNDRKNNKDYITIMNDTIDSLRNELYNN